MIITRPRFKELFRLGDRNILLAVCTYIERKGGRPLPSAETFLLKVGWWGFAPGYARTREVYLAPI